jgi:hypothetical protein
VANLRITDTLLRKKVPVTFLLFLASCGAQLPLIKRPGNGPLIPAEQGLEGQLMSSEGSPFSLGEDLNRPTVLIFASEFCISCREEQASFIAALKNPASNPTRVRLITVVVDLDQIEDLAFWKDEHKIPWTAALDTRDTLFKDHCPERKTPCTLVHVPGKGIVLRHVGITSPESVIAETGVWED